MCCFPSLKAADFVPRESFTWVIHCTPFPNSGLPSHGQRRGDICVFPKLYISQTDKQQALVCDTTSDWLLALVPGDLKEGHFLEMWGLDISLSWSIQSASHCRCPVTGRLVFGSGKGSAAQVQLIIYSVWPSPSSTRTLGLMLNPNPFPSFLAGNGGSFSQENSKGICCTENTPIPRSWRKGRIGTGDRIPALPGRVSGILRSEEVAFLSRFYQWVSVSWTQLTQHTPKRYWLINADLIIKKAFPFGFCFSVRRPSHLVEWLETLSHFFSPLTSRTVGSNMSSFGTERLLALKYHLGGTAG